MHCEGLKYLKGCGRCNINIYDDTLPKVLHSTSVVKLVALLTTDNSFNDIDKATVDDNISSIRITCKGKVLVEKKYPMYNIRHELVKHISCNLLIKWCMYHTTSTTVDSSQTIINTVESLRSKSSTSIFNASCILLAKSVIENNSCTEMCNEIDTDRYYGTCMMNLGNMNMICKLPLCNVLEMLYEITNRFLEKDKDNLFIDINASYLRCNGEVVINGYTTTLSSTLFSVKKLCSSYLINWYTLNRSNSIDSSTCIKVRNFINNKYSLFNINKCIYDTLYVPSIRSSTSSTKS